MSEIRGWEVFRNGLPYAFTDTPARADAYRRIAGYTATPLVAAPSEGAPSWEQMADWISRQGIHSEACLREQDEGGHCICGLDEIIQGLSCKDTA